jgi:hypothetical protein
MKLELERKLQGVRRENQRLTVRLILAVACSGSGLSEIIAQPLRRGTGHGALIRCARPRPLSLRLASAPDPFFNTTKGRIIAADLASKSDRPRGQAGAVRLVLDKPAREAGF